MCATVRGKHSSRYGDSGADEKSAESKLERGRIALEDDAADRRLKFEGLAEIATEELLEILAVLCEERLIEIEGVAKLDDFSGCGAFAEHLLDGIARDDVDHEKDQSENEPERGEREDKSLEEVAGHQRESAARWEGKDFAAFTDCDSSLGGAGCGARSSEAEGVR